MKTMKMTGELLMTLPADSQIAVLQAIIADGQLQGEHDWRRSLWTNEDGSGECFGWLFAMSIAADTVAWWWIATDETRPRELTITHTAERHISAEFVRRCADLVAAENESRTDPLYQILMATDENDPEAIKAAENCGLGWTAEDALEHFGL